VPDRISQDGVEFWGIAEAHFEALDRAIVADWSLLRGDLAWLTRFPGVLTVQSKAWLLSKDLESLRNPRTLELRINRETLTADSIRQIGNSSASDFRRLFRIKFVSGGVVEDGQDAGALHRSWLCLLADKLFAPNYGLFRAGRDARMVSINPISLSVNQALSIFRFTGRLIAHAILFGERLPIHLAGAIRRHLLGRSLVYTDLAQSHPEVYESLESLRTIPRDIEPSELVFVGEVETAPGLRQTFELAENGAEKAVTAENFKDYADALVVLLLEKSIATQLEAFESGFEEVLPRKYLNLFTSNELDLLIAGLPTFDVKDLAANLDFDRYDKDSDVVKWFIEMLEEGTEEFRARVLAFVTDGPSVPIGGFGALNPKMTIKREDDPMKHPVAHACSNLIVIPAYPSKEVLVRKLIDGLAEAEAAGGYTLK
jgi:hypothetical protein